MEEIVGECAGVIHEDVNGAKVRLHSVDHRVDRFGNRHIRLIPLNPGPWILGAKQLNRLLGTLTVDIHNGNCGTCLRESLRDREAEPLSSAGNDRGLTLK